jgi:hypothetical protein
MRCGFSFSLGVKVGALMCVGVAGIVWVVVARRQVVASRFVPLALCGATASRMVGDTFNRHHFVHIFTPGFSPPPHYLN